MTTVQDTHALGTSPALRYSNVAIALHWAIAAFILYNLTSGLLKPVLPPAFFMFHVSSGITILVLTIVRVGWRLTHRPPAFLPMKPWEARVGHVTHVLLYAGMLLMPLSGWAMVSASPPAGSPGAAWAASHPPGPAPAPAPDAPADHPATGGGAAPRGPAMIWGIVPLPLIGPVTEAGRTPAGVPHQRALQAQLAQVHATGGLVMLLLVLLHVAGALKHQFVDRSRELARMGLGRP